MRIVRQGLALALLGAGLAMVPGIQGAAVTAAPAAPGPAEPLVQQMRSAAEGRVKVSDERATGRVGFIRARGAGGDLLPGAAGDSTRDAVAKASAYLDEYGAAFGAAPGELAQTGVRAYRYGWIVRFEQTYRGLPVFGAELKANVDQQGDLTAVSGYAAPDLSLDVTPRVSENQAGQRAVATVRAHPPGADDGRNTDVSGLEAADAELVVYRTGVTRGQPGEALLAWVVDVTNGHNIRERVFLDAASGKPVNRYSMVHDALERELYEAFVDDNGTPDDESDDFIDTELVWEDGDPWPGTLTGPQANLVASAGDSYWFFHNAWNRDSYDGQGARMVMINSDPTPGACPNASWNGSFSIYCAGVTSDDVVAHEWGHAYTEHTSGLVYQWQPGAMNEAYSDIWGETIDLINGREDGGEGDLATPRPDGQCSAHTRGPIQVTINSPAEVGGPCEAAAPASFGPVFDKAGVSADVVVARDADEDAADPGFTHLDGCSAYTDPAAVAGRWAYVDRGGCTFQEKADRAAAAGALGIVVGDNVADRTPISMSATSDLHGLMVTKADGDAFKQAGTANITVKDAGPGATADSFRWLIGEKSPALGGAIRDMWNPTCYGHPGKVSDAEYWCDTDDSGGVHVNSGVVNHSYSLLVDGGSYNDVEVTGIGLDKAAHVYWQAQSAHLTPTSDFADLADALSASCAELVGQPLRQLSVERETPGDLGVAITPADCVQVDNAVAAVDLRLDPTPQCDFKPLLSGKSPNPCGKNTRSVTVWGERFQDGLTGWQQSAKVVFDAGHGIRWRATDDAPEHRSRAAYAPDPTSGSCAGDADDISSRNSLISPTVRMPGRVRAPRLTFDHYVATESGWDGGNLRVKVNGGGWKLVPQRAYLFNKPTGVLETRDAGNTNPLAGQPGWTGTDGGEVFGSWGETQVDLARLGVGKRDRVRIRFDFGRDGCNGLDGWYVDNVKILKCKWKAGRTSEEVSRG